jgi:hypothetical protein
MITRTTLSLVLLVACGGAPQPAPQQPAPEKEHRHPRLPASVDAFHEVLSPIWHSEPGAVRIAEACKQTGLLSERATRLVTDPPPPEASDKLEVWKVATSELAVQVGELKVACAAGPDKVEDKLTALHEGFHRVGIVVSEMGDHGDRRPPGGTGHHGGPGEH